MKTLCILIAFAIASTISVSSKRAPWTTSSQYCAPKIIVFCIHSSPKNYNLRESLRETWLSDLPDDTAYRFVIGKPTAGDKIPSDFNRSDVLAFDGEDSYNRLLSKTVFFMDWARNEWNPKFVARVNDDVYLDIGKILENVKAKNSTFIEERFYYGKIWSGPPIRDTVHKNCIRMDKYPFEMLPPYAQGSFFILSRDLVDYIVLNKALLLQKDSHFECNENGSVEDIQIAIWLIALGVVPIHDHRITDASLCLKNSVALADVEEDVMRSIHHSLSRGESICSREVFIAASEFYIGQSKMGYIDATNNAALYLASLGELDRAMEYCLKGFSMHPSLNSELHGTMRLIQRLRRNGCDQECQSELMKGLQEMEISRMRHITLPFYTTDPRRFREGFGYIHSDF